MHFYMIVQVDRKGGSKGVGLGRKRGLSTKGPDVRRTQKDARLNSCGCVEGPIENDFLQGPEFCATPLGGEREMLICSKDKFEPEPLPRTQPTSSGRSTG